MEEKTVQWSYSGLKQYSTCARQYHEVKVLRKYPREETEQTLYGTRLHEQAEFFIKDHKPLDPDFKFMQPVMDKLAAMPGRKYPEYEMALTHDLRPCDFKSPDYWVRGIADLVIIDDDNLTARIFDYKSGGDKFPDTDQLTLMSLMVFAYFPHVRHVTSGLLFVLKNSVVKHRVDREQAQNLWWKYRERVGSIALSHANNSWPPTQSGLCKKYCAVRSCELNGRN
jgi:hypothetical protein